MLMHIFFNGSLFPPYLSLAGWLAGYFFGVCDWIFVTIETEQFDRTTIYVSQETMDGYIGSLNRNKMI